MTWIYLVVVSIAVFFVTISLVVIGQEISVLLAIALFIALSFLSYKIAAKRLTRL